MYKKNSHCSYCGAAFAEEQPWPRQCGNCGRNAYLNPLPVAVILVPVDDGLLVVRRGITPGRGELALPGGYIGLGETWQEAGAREVWEETGLRLDPAEIRDFTVLTAPEGMVLIFGRAAPRRAADLPPFVPNPECTERLVIPAPVPLAFPLHTAAAQAYFAGQRVPV
jgi:ADP-ribose pyrophosphatase YjhB (NUDIX family)